MLLTLKVRLNMTDFIIKKTSLQPHLQRRTGSGGANHETLTHR